MQNTRKAARHDRRRHTFRRRLVIVVPVALAATAVLAYVVVAALPGRDAGTGRSAAVSIAPDQGNAPTATRSPTTTMPPATSRTPAPKSPTAKASTPTPSQRPSATAGPRPVSATAPLAGRVQPRTRYTGVATVYQAGNGDGACLFGPSADLMIAAMNTTDFESSKACGDYVLVHAANGASVTVLITNECPLPCAPGQLDLSEPAFAKLADPHLGRIPITWQLLSPASVGTLSIRYKVGSSQYWCGIQVLHHRNPVARLEVRASGGWRSLPRTAYDYFLSADGTGCGGSIRITDIYGERLVVDGLAVRPDVVQPARVQFAQH